MSEQTLQLVHALRERLRQAIRRISVSEAAFGVVVTLAVAACLWTVFAAAEAVLWLPSPARLVLLVLAVGGSALVFAWLAGRPLLRLLRVLPGHPDDLIALRIGQKYPEVGDRLRNLLDLSEGRSSEAPAPLLDGAVQMLGRQLMPVPFEEVEDFSRPRRAARLSLVPVLALIVFAVAAPATFFDASHRLVAVNTAFERPAPYALAVLPGDVEIIRGADLHAQILASGRKMPDRITLAINHQDEERVEQIDVTADSVGRYQHAVLNVRRPLRYRVESDHVTSRWYQVDVLERPVLRGLQVTLRYPVYSRLGTRRLEPNVGDVSALSGTRVRVEVGLGAQQLNDAFLAFDDGSTEPLQRDGQSGVAEFVLRGEGSYKVTLVGENDIENAEPVEYQLDAISDAPPTIGLFSPDPTMELDRSLAVPVGAQVRDDFGFSDLKLYYRLAESRYKAPSDSFQVLDLSLNDPASVEQTIAYRWQLDQSTSLDPVPGDVVEYYLRVWDNDAWAGYKSATSERFKLIVPSLSERYRALDEEQESTEQEIVDILQETESIRSDFEALRNELRRNQEGTWENQRQLEQIENRQSQVESRVEQLSERLDAMTQEMQTNDLVSDETLEMYEELRKVVDEINSPELREALERLQQAMEDLNLEQVQESLGDFEFNEQQYRQRLERTLDLFKQMRVQQQLDEAARRAEELAEQQRALAEQTQQLMEDSEQRGAAEEREDASEAREASESNDEEGRPSEGAASDSEQAGEEGESPEDGGSEQSSEESGDKANRPSADDLAREQERARQEAQELLERLQNAGADMSELRNRSQEAMEQLLDQAQQQQLPQQMQQNADQLRQQQLQDAQQGQQQMSQQLQQMSSTLRQMQQSMSGASMNVNVAGIRRALEDVLTLSQRQETARQGVQGLAPESPAIREYAQEQVRLAEGLSTVADSLQHLSREIPQMSRTVQQFTGEALREMSSATEALADRSARTGAAHQQGAMMHLNELALVLADLMDQMMSGGGGGGMQSMQQMLDQLQQMSGQQEQLNQQIQQFLNDMQGNRLASDAEERLQQMARQQDAIRQQLREMSRNSEARGQLMGDLNRIAEQMEETIQELQAARADRQTIERQQQILTRLLEAQKSLRERDREERREGRSADDLFREGPDALPPAEEVEQLRRDLLRALEAGYAPEYQELIKRYFEMLQQQSAPTSAPDAE